MTAAGLVSAPQPPPEEVVWSYAVQMTSALRAAHGCGLLLRPACLHPSKVRAAQWVGGCWAGCVVLLHHCSTTAASLLHHCKRG